MASEQDIRNLAWTMLGEAYPGDTAGMSAVGNTVLNRLNSGNYGSTISSIVKAPNQFAAWGIGSQAATQGNDPQGRFPVGSPEFDQAYTIAQQLVDGDIPDNTGGAVNYRQTTPGTQWSGSAPDTIAIGGNTFQTQYPIPPMNVPAVASDYADTTPPGAANPGVVPLAASQPFDIPSFNPFTAGDELALDPVTSADAGGATAPPMDAGYNPATGLVQPYTTPDAMAAFGGTGFPSSTLPSTTTSAPAAPQTAAPAPQTVIVNGHTYQVGAVLQTHDGRSYQVQADGSMTPMPHISVGANTVAAGVVAPLVSNAIQAVPGALSSAGGAISGIFGKLFGGGSSAPAQAPPPSITPPGYNTVTDAQRTALDALNSTPPSALADTSSWAQPYLNSVDPNVASALLRLNAPQTSYGGYIPGDISGSPYSPLNGGGNPSQMVDPSTGPLSYLMSPSYPSPSSSASSPYGGPYNEIDAEADPTSPTYQAPVAQTTQVLNPAYTAWMNNQTTVEGDQGSAAYGVDGVPTPSLDSSGNLVMPSSYLGAASTPAPPEYISQTNYVTPPLADSPINGMTADSSLADWFGSTPLGHITSALTGGTQAPAWQKGGLLSALFNSDSPVASFLSGLGGAASGMSPAPPAPVNNAPSLVSNYGLTPAQAAVYANGGAAMQAANPNPVVAAVTGALNVQPPSGYFGIHSTGSTGSSFGGGAPGGLAGN